MSDEILPWDKPPVPVTAEPQPRLPAVQLRNLPRSDKPLNGHHVNGAKIPSIAIDPKAPLEIAERYVAERHKQLGQTTLCHQQGVFTTWTGTHYREFMGEEVRADLYRFLKNATTSGGKFKPTSKSVSDVADALRAACQLEGTLRAPCWLGEDTSALPVAREIIACRNGLLHLETGELTPHSPAFFTRSALDYDFVPDAPPPSNWLKFLASVWPEDRDCIDTLQEIFGYLLGSDTDQQKIPLLVGPKRSGKGTIGRVLSAMVGQDAVVSPTLGSLESNFGAQPLIGKSVAIIADARLSGRADQQAIAERLLSISGEDLQTIDRKHMAAWTGRLGVRFFIMSNELPGIADASGALASRFVIMTMTKSFFGSEDHGLTGNLLAELPSILNWAVAGWKRLRERKYFKVPASSADAVQQMADLSSPVSAFLREHCDIGPGKTVAIDAIYRAWCDWCSDQGRDKPGTKGSFGKALRSAAPGIADHQPNDGGKRYRAYEGIALKALASSDTDQRGMGFD